MSRIPLQSALDTKCRLRDLAWHRRPRYSRALPTPDQESRIAQHFSLTHSRA